MAYIGFDVENRLHNTAFTFDSYTSDGVTSIYALSVPKPLTSRAVLVSFDGLTQQPELDYTLDGESNLKIINVPVNTTQIQTTAILSTSDGDMHTLHFTGSGATLAPGDVYNIKIKGAPAVGLNLTGIDSEIYTTAVFEWDYTTIPDNDTRIG